MSNHKAVKPASSEALEEQVERNREDLARTVDALHDKLDVKAHAQERVLRLKEAATTDSGKPSPALVGVAAIAVVGVVALVWRRGRT